MKNLLILTMLFFASCANLVHQTDDIYQTLPKKKIARSSNGVVSTAHPLATNAAIKMLEAGGNAMDAAVAAAFTLSVVEPSMSGCLLYTSQSPRDEA